MIKKVLICVTSHKRISSLKKLILCLKKQTYSSFMVIVVDNALDDNIQELLSKENIIYIRPKKNIGPAGAIKLVASKFLSEEWEYFWILDDDLYFENKTLESLINQFSQKPQEIVAISPQVATILNGEVKYLIKKNKLFLKHANWGGLFCKRAIFENNIFPKEELFWGWEDSEFTFSITQHGFKIISVQNPIIYTPSKKINIQYLKNQQSNIFIINRILKRRVAVTPWRNYYYMRNTLYLSLHGKWIAFPFFLRFLLGCISSFDLQTWKSGLIAMLHAYKNKMGKQIEPSQIEYQ